jgi:hypothetical protein
MLHLWKNFFVSDPLASVKLDYMFFAILSWRHDIQHNDIQHNGSVIMLNVT